MHWYYYVLPGLVWVVLIFRWRLGKSRRRRGMLAATAGFARDKAGRGGF